MTTKISLLERIKNNKFLLSTTAEIFGVLSIIAGISAASQGQSSSNLDGGFFILIGAWAYKSAKKRKLGLIKKYILLRIVLEILAILFIIFGVIAVGLNSPYKLNNDPFPYLICPLWAIIAYVIVNFKNYKP